MGDAAEEITGDSAGGSMGRSGPACRGVGRGVAGRQSSCSRAEIDASAPRTCGGRPLRRSAPDQRRARRVGGHEAKDTSATLEGGTARPATTHLMNPPLRTRTGRTSTPAEVSLGVIFPRPAGSPCSPSSSMAIGHRPARPSGVGRRQPSSRRPDVGLTVHRGRRSRSDTLARLATASAGAIPCLPCHSPRTIRGGASVPVVCASAAEIMLGLKNLRLHALRLDALTSLGIILGVAAVIVVTARSGGGQQAGSPSRHQALGIPTSSSAR